MSTSNVPTPAAGPKPRHGQVCRSCASPRLDGRYCAHCGEKFVEPKDLTLVEFLKDAFHFQTHLDNRVVATVLPILREPGILTLAWIRGNRKDYAKPIQLFFVINVLFFLLASKMGILLFTVSGYSSTHGLPGIAIASILAKQAELGYTAEQFIRALNSGLEPHKKWLFLILIPITTLLLLVFHPRRKVLEHLVYSIHYATFLFLFLMILAVFVQLTLLVGNATVLIRPLIALCACYLIGYQLIAVRRVYGLSKLRAAMEAVVLTLGLAPAIIASERLAYYLAFHAL